MAAQVTTAQKLKEIRERVGFSMEKLAKAMGMAAGSSYQRYEDEESYVRSKFMRPDLVEKIASAVVGRGNPPVTRDEVLALAGLRENAAVDIHAPSHAKQSIGETSLGRVRSATGEPAVFGPKDVKVLGFVKAGRIGWYHDNGSTLEMIDRPPMLIGVPDAYAVYIDDRSMFPALKPGHLVWVHPYRPPRPEDLVIVQVSHEEAYVKEFIKRTDKHIICKQYNPEGEVRYPVTAKIHLVVGVRTVG